MHHLLSRHARTTPDAIALLAPECEPLTYANLWQEIERNASALSAIGFTSGDRIALVVPDGPELVTAFLAITKVAAAAPLNPSYRESEFDFYLSDVNASALVVPAGFASPAIEVARSRGIPVIELVVLPDAPAGVFVFSSSSGPRPAGTSSAGQDAALFLHTSGTTSRPKLVPLSLANIRASALNTAASLDLTPADRCLNVMPLFHVHGLVGATLSSLSVGASVVCTPGFRAPKFFDWLETFRPTWYTAVPTMHQAVVARALRETEMLSQHPLRFVRSCSAALSPAVRVELEQTFRVPVVEAYGMTEACHQMASTPLGPGRQKPGSVGPAAGPEVGVMDDSGALLSQGACGEVVIRGVNVTTGYQDNDAANAAAFSNGWFRTGDQGFLDDEGYLHLTGRLKEIINRGGEKIAPREIDEVLAGHPAVNTAVAFGVPDTRLGEAVAAAVVLRSGMQATEREIREFASTQLVDFKVPSRIVFVDEIPKGPTGKLQRVGLAAKLGIKEEEPPAATAASGAKAGEGPRTPLERAIAAIFVDVLGVKQVGRHDNFFDLGGDSILAAQILEHVRDVLNVELKLIDLFDGKTVAAMAEAVRTNRSPAAASPPVGRRPEATAAPLSFGQQRFWFFAQLHADSPLYIHPVAIRLKGELDTQALQRSLNALLERHAVLRAAFPGESGQPRQLIASHCSMPFEVLDLGGLPDTLREEAVRSAMVREATRPLDITVAPLCRSTLFRLGDGDQILLITMHHLISDGWSDRPLLRDLSAFYAAFRDGTLPRLPALPIQYPDFSAWQTDRLDGPVLRDQLAYWRQNLSPPLPVLALPTDRPRPKVRTHKGERESLRLPAELRTALEELSRQEGVTLFMTLLAAFQILLARYSGQHDIIVGAPVAGRTRVETEELVGSFVNTLALRIDLSGDPSLRELLARVRTMALDAFANQEVPFEKLVEVLRPERSPDRDPVFQVGFNFRNYPRSTAHFPGLEAEQPSVHLGVSMFDLMLEVVETHPGLELRLEYTTDLFDPATARRMLGDLVRLLDGVESGRDRSIWALPLPPPPERQPSKEAPASDAQQRLWFLDRVEPGAPTYNVPLGFRLSGDLNVEALARSLDAIVRRHDVLRTAFELRDREPVQVIAPSVKLVLRHVELSHVPLEEREPEAQRLIAEDVAEPFDLSRPSLMRALLVRVAPREHVLVLTIHHIITDGWSTNVLLHEVGECYAANVTGTAVPLEPLPLQFADYVRSERARLQDAEIGKQLEYWKKQLNAAPHVLDLPLDRPRTNAVTSQGSQHVINIPAAVMEDLKSLGRSAKTTMFMTMMAAFQALLSRYTSQEQFLVGTPFGGRHRAELEPLIGLFVNTVVFNADVSGNPTFRELLRQVRDTAMGAFSNTDLPFDRLVSALASDRTPGATPLIQASFVFEDEAVPPRLPGLDVVSMTVTTETAKFDLALSVTVGASGAAATFRYRTDLFDHATVARIGGHFQTLLAGIIAEPDRPISGLPILTESERHQLLVGWNQTAAPLPGRSIHEVFEAQAGRTPEAIALACEDRRVTYRELNGRANQLAHHLRKLDVKPEALVALCVERSVEMIVALLGILKAAGAYVPLDPADPDVRRTAILNDTGARVVLTVAALRNRFDNCSASVVCLDTDWPEIETAGAANPDGVTTPDDLAYVMFTSGSTGIPKGVGVPHRGVLRLFAGDGYAHFGPDETLLLVSPLGFDVSTFEIWGPLLHGGRLVVMPQAKPSLLELGQALEEHHITTAWFTADLFHQMVDHQLPRLRAVPQVLAGGDVVSAPHVRKFFEAPGDGTLINGYGPTENTTFTSCHPMRDAEGLGDTVPIGRPIANTQVYVLDRHRQPVPVGVPGELYTGGDGVARGYWNRPELTAAAFVDNPFGEPGSRLYKTGDQVKYRPDGRLEFLGRFDRQVKIRGFRIELEAVEAAVTSHPDVDSVAVVAREDGSGGKSLVAYIASKTAMPSTTDLRQHLGRMLPGYMVPSVFVPMERLPLTARGKIDLAALPAPDGERPTMAAAFAGPRNAVEEQIAAVWRRVLRIEQVGIHDDFFDLGGHSLLAVQVMAHIEKDLGQTLRLAVLFEAPTIAQLAERIEHRAGDESWSTLVPIETGGSRRPFFCVHGAGGNVLIYSSLARHLRPNQPVYGVQALGLNPEHSPHTDLEVMAADYIAEMKTVQSTGPYFLGGLSFGGVVAFEMARQLRAQGEETAFLALFDAFPPGFQKSLSWQQQVSNYAQRAKFHAGELLGSDRGTYLQKRLKTGRRRLRQKVWRLRSARYRAAGQELPAALRKVSEANHTAFRNYAPQPYDGPVTLFSASDRLAGMNLGDDHGWRAFAGAGLEIIQVPGNHATFMAEPAVTVLAERLGACLEKAHRPGDRG